MALSEKEEFELLSLEREKSQFASTAGGAAVGNPNIQRQGDRALRGAPGVDGAASIAGAGAIGAGLGTFSSELLTGAGRIASVFPQTARIAPFLETAGYAAKAAGRASTAISGGLSGLASETAGQMVEAAGGPQVAAEGARLAGGMGGDIGNAAKEVLKKYAVVPALGLASKFKHEFARKLLEKIEGTPQSLSERERQFVDSITGDIRGGPKSDVQLENVGSIMGAEGRRLLSESETKTAQALRQAGNVGNPGGYPAANQEMADIGGGLRSAINKRDEQLRATRGAQYTENEKVRNEIVQGRESANDFIENIPEYKGLIKELEGRLLKTREARLDSPTLKIGDTGTERSLSSILDAVSSRRVMISESEAAASVAKGYKIVRGTNPANGEPAVYRQFPSSFDAIDDVRRRLGDVFRGAPDEGYAAIGAKNAELYYGKLSEIQKAYAGGANGPQAKLLDDYAKDTKGLEKFSSTFGKKATALDQYREGQFSTDASTLPSAFFKTRASIQALQELTGNKTQVQAAALEYANKELAGMDAGKVRKWMSDNSEWLSEVTATRSLVDKYATRLEGSERSSRNAADFASRAEKNADMLIGKGLPAQQAVDLIKSGSVDMWAKIIPVIQKSPVAQGQMVMAVRQVIADQAESKAASNLFSRSIRPFLERSGIATTAEMNGIAGQLAAIQAKSLPEQQKLGLSKRLILQSIGGYTAGGASRLAVGGYGLLSDQIPQ